MDYEILLERYQNMLSNYIKVRGERALYKGQQFSRKMIEQNVSPEEVVSLHIEVLNNLLPDLDEKMYASLEFLLEVMIGYGFAYREHQSLRDRQQQLDSEIDIAANVQQSLLKGKVPDCDFIDIGVISQPAKKMSGDYYHFVMDDNNCISVAVADIVGKGIPAAMCMSMIKYSMDSLPEQRMQPGAMLESLNRVVEQNVDPSMFITMFYGIYDPRIQEFSFASAGHEPGFYYSADSDYFDELSAKGLVLGLSRTTTYQEYVKTVGPGDMIILLSDGVTECRTEKGFIEREEIIAMIRRNMHLSAQKIVDNVFYELEKLQDFELRDDFTLLVMKF
ncbi:sigma-B regulation protein RsbU (phosphoserine phosphatase) [Scopulibacillus darangshiensis]|uniref:Sigma-B regulation protein RsbU (Phosphoserine phosphatase) n=1 Tax=Scopulibacillus darangshiensis TaxID=442528 RepID=A0A4R2NPS3_9BACL|nr:PP2C family protein-serine/threonine phosphatase [Scopulibacillus darangshiensis]TCP23829.1 sigma-B regulation protein RsbU (phosphoserine phosphatase) [Scopulibacillus darangshiensis]